MEKRRGAIRRPVNNYSEAEKLEATKAMTSSIIESTKILVLINGGAIVALVSQYKDIHVFFDPIRFQIGCSGFVVGLVFATFGTFFNWLGQVDREGHLRKPSERQREAPRFLLWAGIAIYAGIGAFTVGAGWLIWAIK